LRPPGCGLGLVEGTRLMSRTNLQQEWIERFSAWAASRDDVRAALVVGSRGRTDSYPAEEWSDVDVAIITTRPGLYATDSAWMRDIGPFWVGVMSPDETFGGLVRVYCGFSVYEEGLAVDFLVLSHARARWMMRVNGWLNRYPGLRRRLPGTIARLGAEWGQHLWGGVRVLVDKDGLAERMRQVVAAIPVVPTPPPSPQAFQHAVDDFWVGAPRVVAELRRGHLMGAVKILDMGRKHLLRWMVWHARAKDGWPADEIGYRPKWVERWADPRAVEALPQICPRVDEDELWRALFAMMDLFRWLAAETAERLGIDYASEADAQVTAWVKRCFDERGSARR
jgi:aminoglycoside 6-adenylyltransferase